MDIETELPEDFDSLTDEEKVEELEGLKQNFTGNSDSEVLKKRIVEELIRKYSGGT